MSLKFLFGIVAFCAVIAWCANQMGYASPYFWSSVVLNSLMAVAFVLAQETSSLRYFRITIPFLLLISLGIPGLAVSGVSSFSLLLIVYLIMVSTDEAPSLQLKLSASMLSVAAALVLATVPGFAAYRELMSLRNEYPLEDIQSRLTRLHDPRSQSVSLQMSPQINGRLIEQESEYDARDYRKWYLRKIHDENFELFVRANGFGYRRMGTGRPNRHITKPLVDVAFNHNLVQGEFDLTWNEVSYVTTMPIDAVDQVHSISQQDFLDPEGFGYIEEPKGRVAGFVEHAFHYSPIQRAENPDQWEIVSLELVSLLKYDTPRVYVLDHLPRMDQLNKDDVKTRALNEFESEGLKRLWTQEDLVIENQESKYQMLGSLRAAKQCLQCHNVERGELLGAFTYQIVRH